jgi:uncharacterized protein (TIGR03118 family)
MEVNMKQRQSNDRRRRLPLVGLAALIAGSLIPIGSATAFGDGPGTATASGTVLQTNLVSDLPGVAAVTDPNLVNPWGISESAASPFWISDNNSNLSTLYAVPGASPPVSINPLAVKIPTPVSLAGGTPTGTVFNTGGGNGAFKITGPNKSGQMTSVPALFLFATEDGTIAGWNPTIDPSGQFAGPGGVSAQAVIAVDNSGNNFTNPDPNQQTGAVYKGLAIDTSATPIIAGDADSTALLYVSNFRAGAIEVYDAGLNKVTTLSMGAFGDPALPKGYAPFNVQLLNGKVYVTYALQDVARHDDVAGPHHGFVDVFNPDGTAGLPGGNVRLISQGALDSPWGLAIAPQGFGGLTAPNNDPVLVVGNFGDGHITAFDAATGSSFGQLEDPDGEPIQIDGLWALRVGNGGNGGATDTVYFTAGLFGESHGLFGSLDTVAPGSPEGSSEAQSVQALVDLVQLDVQQLAQDASTGASRAILRQDTRALDVDSHELVTAERAFARDALDDAHS